MTFALQLFRDETWKLSSIPCICIRISHSVSISMWDLQLVFVSIEMNGRVMVVFEN